MHQATSHLVTTFFRLRRIRRTEDRQALSRLQKHSSLAKPRQRNAPKGEVL